MCLSKVDLFSGKMVTYISARWRTIPVSNRVLRINPFLLWPLVISVRVARFDCTVSSNRQHFPWILLCIALGQEPNTCGRRKERIAPSSYNVSVEQLRGLKCMIARYIASRGPESRE